MQLQMQEQIQLILEVEEKLQPLNPLLSQRLIERLLIILYLEIELEILKMNVKKALKQLPSKFYQEEEKNHIKLKQKSLNHLIILE